MFLVRDKIKERHKRIERFLDSEDASIAILLAAIDFERTIRRAILGLGHSPTKVIRRDVFGKDFHGLKAFKAAWRDQIRPCDGRQLATGVVTDWGRFVDAFQERHRIIHGVQRRFTPEFASKTARQILTASQQVHDYAKSKNVELDGVIRRYKDPARRARCVAAPRGEQRSAI